MTSDFLPVFATNRADLDLTVAGEVNRLFRMLREHYSAKPDAAIATAYINPGGFALLADELERVPRIRLLLGAEPEQETVRRLAAQDADYDDRLSRALATHEDWLVAERDTTGFSRQASDDARRMVGWLRSVDPQGEARVEVRRYSDGFLHGKAYIADHPVLPGVLAGSSNFTFAGLSRNAELNLGYPTGEHTSRVIDWFEHYWANSDPYDLAGLYAEQWQPHEPWPIFLRMLTELYGDHLDEERPGPTELHLAPFQSDGVARMERLLDSMNGVLVADEVGLGKTFLAGEVIRKATDERRQRVLVIAPAALKENVWKPFIRQYGLRLTEVLSYEEVRDRMRETDPRHTQFLGEVEDTAMVVVDEAHNLRNAGAARSEAVDRVILSGKYPKQVVLLTATPVNNSLTDLETLIRYFVRDDAQFASIGIASIREYIKHAQSIEPENLSPEHLFDLMDQVAVRRTRKFVKEQYPNQRVPGPGGTEVVVAFPKPEVRRIDYELPPSGITLIDRMIYALDRPDDSELYVSHSAPDADPWRLKLARYTSSGYLIGQSRPEGFQVNNAGLLRSALLKRLESSPNALRSTLTTLIDAHRVFLDALSRGWVLQGEALRDWGSSESDELDEYVEHLDADEAQQAQPAAAFHVDELTTDVESDVRLLRELLELTDQSIAEAETKAQRLVEELAAIALAARSIDPTGLSSADRRKVIVFSTYSDTIVALHDFLVAAIRDAPHGHPLVDYRDRLAPAVMGAYASVQKRGATGGVDQAGRKNTIEGFAPMTAGPLGDDGRPLANDLYDILLTTDVLAEGVNLQQAGQIINYDLPWNPMRIVQRHGRVDRIGSRHAAVRLGLFFPAERLDEMLHLETTLERKLAQADAAVGAGEVLPGRRSTDPLAYSDQHGADPDRAVAEFEDLLEQRGSSAALSGEEYRRRLFTAVQHDTSLRKHVGALPFGSGSGFENAHARANGYVFCVRIGEEAKPWFRYVECDERWWPTGRISDDTLVSLVAADPVVAGTPRWMTDDVYDGAFDSWVLARRSVFEGWDRLTDPNNLVPDVPKAFRDAADLVRRAGAFLGTADQRALLDKLRSVPTARVTRAVRAALAADAPDENRIRLVLAEVQAAGLQIPVKPKPLPEVSLDQVRLVCWMAVRGTHPA
ncbi:SNF2-related protein [uncultured Amnibacterium sp.]|uniref:SNF2-related protein n=1 Tax=uncultured Amnibacterium sp. TaxID=1631851 RepID=UPI0035CAD105